MAEKLTLKLGTKPSFAPKASGITVEVIKKRRVPGEGAAVEAIQSVQTTEQKNDRIKSLIMNAKRELSESEKQSQELARADAERIAQTVAAQQAAAVVEAKKPASSSAASDKKDASPKSFKKFDEAEGARRVQTFKPTKSSMSTIDAVDFEDESGAVSTSLSSAMDIIGLRAHRRSHASMKRQREKNYRKFIERTEGDKAEAAKVSREVVLPETISVKDLAVRMNEKSSDVVKAMMKLGIMATINQIIDADTAELVVLEFGHTVKRVLDSDVETEALTVDAGEEVLAPRAPVVVVMGHVDHGKTSLLDAFRKADVVSGEAGGITQHIGAYQVKTSSGRKITFIDTPGHEAFSAMRSRGAAITDVAILVVAANDSIMPQTVEAINHAKAAGVPMIVAINKIDLPDANPNKVRQDLLQHSVVVEAMGGTTIDVEISAKNRTNLEKLEEMILLQADMLELKGNVAGAAKGTVIEAKVEQGRGSVATILVQKGQLKKGDIFVSGSSTGRVRDMLDEYGKRIVEAGPSTPVVVFGFEGTPVAGDDFAVLESEAKAREIAAYRKSKEAQKKMVRSKSSWQEIFEGIKEGSAQELPVIIKGDTQGSIEAIADSLVKIPSEKVKVRVMHSGVGGINESDISLAKATGSVILAFNVRANTNAKDEARAANIDIRYYSIIYQMIDDVKVLMSGLLAPVVKEVFVGYADVIATFNAGKTKVAGCLVSEGVIKKGSGVRMIRDDVVIFTGKLAQLKRAKDDVKEVRAGTECGVSFDNFNDIQVGDKLECFDTEEIKATI
ncbi:MAG: translation initiation factor IF-2 [Alphaproteobacteria bacterium]|nr:translation initiation factor IF-2 [Alphaproteobacteria bacterium]